MSAENSFWGTCEVQISAVGWLRAFFCMGAPVSNKDMVAAWFKTSCSSPCALALLVLFQVYTARRQNPSNVTVAGFHLELDFWIHVRVSISPRFNESGHKGECKCPGWKRLTTLLHVFFLCVALWKTSSESLCLMCKQHLKTNGKNFQFKGSFEDVTLNQQSERLQLAAHWPTTKSKWESLIICSHWILSILNQVPSSKKTCLVFTYKQTNKTVAWN